MFTQQALFLTFAGPVYIACLGLIYQWLKPWRMLSHARAWLYIVFNIFGPIWLLFYSAQPAYALANEGLLTPFFSVIFSLVVVMFLPVVQGAFDKPTNEPYPHEQFEQVSIALTNAVFYGLFGYFTLTALWELFTTHQPRMIGVLGSLAVAFNLFKGIIYEDKYHGKS